MLRYGEHMVSAQLNPEEYSRVIPLPNHGAIDVPINERQEDRDDVPARSCG
jgi:hypothetical protein